MWIASYLLITDLTSQSLLCGAMPRSSLLQDVQVPCSSCAGRAGFVRWKKMLILIYIASVTYELMTTFGNEISLGVAKSIQIPHKNLILRYFQRANPAKSENDPPGLTGPRRGFCRTGRSTDLSRAKPLVTSTNENIRGPWTPGSSGFTVFFANEKLGS